MHDQADLHQNRYDGFAAWLARLIVHRPQILAALACALIAACVAVVATRPRLDSEVLNLLPQRSEAVQALKVFNTEFRQGRELVFALHGEAAAVAEFEEHFVDTLRREPWVTRVFTGSPMESREELAALQILVPQLLLNLEDAPFTAALESLSPQRLEERVQRLRAGLDSGSARAEMEASVDPLGIVGQAMQPLRHLSGIEKQQPLVSADGTLKIFPVVTSQPSLGQADCKALMAQVEQFQRKVRAGWPGDAAPEVLVTGRSAYVAQIGRSMERDVSVTSLISILAVTALFFLAFRRLMPPLATSLILSLSCFVAFTIGCLIFDNLNMIAIAFCSILVGLGDDFSLLLYNRYLLARTHQEPHEQAVATAIREVWKGIAWVALTTGAGFLVLLFSDSGGFAQLGVLIAIGVVLCGVFVLGLLFLFIRPQHAHPERPDPLHRPFLILVKLLLHLPARFAVPASIVALAAVLFAVMPLKTLQFDTNPRSLEPKQIPGAVALRTINEKISAASEPVALLVDSPDASTAHRSWTALEARLNELVAAGVLTSFSSPAALMLSPERLQRHRRMLKGIDLSASRQAFTRALEENGFESVAFESAFALFDELSRAAIGTEERIAFEGQLPKESSWWFLLDRYLSTRPWLAGAYVRPASPLDSAEAQQAFESAIRSCGVPVKVTGWTYALQGLVPWAKRELLVFSVAIGTLIVVCLAIAYRQWKPVLVHTFSLIVALAATISLLKLTGTKVNMLNALAFPLVIGVGVDYGMHLLLALKEGNNVFESLSTVLKPVIISALTTIAGFGALVFARNPALKGLGTVCALGVFSCLITSVFFAVPIMAVISSRRLTGKVVV